MKILFYLGHPAHYHLFKNAIKFLCQKNNIFVLIKQKDVLEKLLINDNIYYSNILPEGRKDSKIGLTLGLIKRDFRMLRYCLKQKPDLMVGTSPEITHVGKLLKIPSINVNEDDAIAVPLYAKFSYPMASEILTPVSCDNDKWDSKSIKYNSYHELSYLHPNYFKPDITVLNRYNIISPFYVVRFAKLTAHHDKNIMGINGKIADKIIDKLKKHGNVYITSERELEPRFEKYRLSINPIDIHHVMHFAQMYIGDSQTMAAEAAVLGTPSLRFNDFVGRLGYLEELEHVYGLTCGVKPSEPEKLFEKIDEYLAQSKLKEDWQLKRQIMLKDKIDTTKFFIWFLENYPNSAKIMRENPEYQYNFR